MASFLVTGGAGFIGSNLTRALVRRGDTVTVLDNFATGREVNLAGIGDKIRLIRGDIRDPAAVDQAMAGCEYVLHQAALPSVPRSVEEPVESNDVNVGGTLVVLQAARKHKVKRLVFAASSSAYGETPTLPKFETMPPDPLSPYAASKVACEHYLRVYHACYGLESIALRYFNVFGPNQDPASQYAAVIPRFITAALEKRPATVFGDGGQSRDFCHIDNAIEANLLACTAKVATGQVLNVACGVRTTLLEVLDLVADITGNRVPPIHEPPRAGDVRHSLADIAAARAQLGYTASVSFRQGLERTIEWYRSRA
jgi:UDP-N-acetylglucosamine/UDP-N-acetyl-alpha-D-glucosaminouronate 4-epimerase